MADFQSAARLSSGGAVVGTAVNSGSVRASPRQQGRPLGGGADPSGKGGYSAESLATGIGSTHNDQSMGSPEAQGVPRAAPGSGTTYYRLRARDSACALSSPTKYVFWTSTVKTLGSYSGSLPCGGPLVELTVLSSRVS